MRCGHSGTFRIGLDQKGRVCLGATVYSLGSDMLSATEEGKRVSYVYRNPKSGGIGHKHNGAPEYKYDWVVRHNGPLFASGRQITAGEYTKFVVNEAIASYADGLNATLPL